MDHDQHSMEDQEHEIDDREMDLTDEQLNDLIPSFKPLVYSHPSQQQNTTQQGQMLPEIALTDDTYMRLHVPSHRYSALKKHWMELYEPIVNYMKLLIRYNPKQRVIELKVC